MGKRRLRGPSPAMAVACIALAVALSGVGYAAVALPRNSVGTAQLKNNAVNSAKVRNNALTGADIREATLGQVPSASTANTANTANSAATAGSADAATNAQNAANADRLDNLDSTAFARPIVGGASTQGMSSPPDASPVATWGPTTFETTASSRVLAQGSAREFRVTCSVVGPCSASFGLYLDGQPIPSSAINLSAGASGTATLASPVVFGVVDGVPAGSHTVTIGYDTLTANVSLLSFGGLPWTSAIALSG